MKYSENKGAESENDPDPADPADVLCVTDLCDWLKNVNGVTDKPTHKAAF